MRRLPDGLILLSSSPTAVRNRDVLYYYRPDSNFLYLSGVEEPRCHLLLDPKRRRSTLFIPRIDNRYRVWMGHIPGPKESRRLYGIPRVKYAGALRGELKKARRGYRKAYTDRFSARLLGKGFRGLKNSPAALLDALDELRTVKTPGELRLMKEAGRVTSRAHRLVMETARPGMREYEVQDIFEGRCRRSGLKHMAYTTICAAGPNSAVLHYERNDRVLRRGQLFLIDAGAESHGYASDITRTFPVGPRFTARQKDVYSIVLETEKAAIRKARAGITSAELHVFSMERIAEGLKSLRLLKGDVAGLLRSGAVRLFYPHGLGHLLGLDVHDGAGGRARKAPNPTKVKMRFNCRLEPGFVMTVEPGIYFIEALLRDRKLREKFKGSVDFGRAERFLDFGGVRIEDDIVVRRSGPPRVITSVPKEVRAVEECRKSALAGRRSR